MHICAYCVCVCFRVTVFAFGNFFSCLLIINYDIPVTHIRL